MPKIVHRVSDSDESDSEVNDLGDRSGQLALAALTSTETEVYDEDDDSVVRTPAAYRVAEATLRPPRKEQSRMFAHLVDLSPIGGDNIETYVMYIVKRKLADDYMRMIFEKKIKNYSLVMTCCDSETSNQSNDSQPKKLNENCVELSDIRETKPAVIDKLSEKRSPLVCMKRKFSNPIAGLMTLADLINRSDNEFSETHLTLYSDLGFKCGSPDLRKMQKVLGKVLPSAQVTVVSDKERMASEVYRENVDFLKEIFDGVTTVSYQDAMNDSEQWSMAEPMPSKWSASIRLFDTEIAIEAYLMCAEKNVSLLGKKFDPVDGKGESFTAVPSIMDVPKKLVKLTESGNYERDSENKLVIVEEENAVKAYKFGQTAVPVAKALDEYVDVEKSQKGFTVRGWYPIDQFSLYVRGGKGTRVYPTENDPQGFDSLLELCAKNRKAILVDYVYAERFAAKSGVLIPYLKKHCFVYFELIYLDALNYLPAFDPVASQKPEIEHIKQSFDVIQKSMVEELKLSKDPQTQQLFEDVWQGRLDEMSTNAIGKMMNVRKRVIKDETLEDPESFHQSIRVDNGNQKPHELVDDVPQSVQLLDDLEEYRTAVADFGSLF